MSLWIGPMRVHLNGHKELTAHNEIVTVKPKGEVFIPLNVSMNHRAEVLVKEGDTVVVGTKIGIGPEPFAIPIYSPVSGVVGKVISMMHPWLKPTDHLVIKDDGKYTFAKSFDPVDIETADRETLVAMMKEAGLMGCGGAGFPTFMKYKNPQNIDTLIINAVECEPYITADYRAMKEYLDDLVYGTRAMLKASTAKKAIIAIKKNKHELCTKLAALLVNTPEITVFQTPDVYPMGWERTLVFEFTKKRYDRLPSEIGVIVNNATTAVAYAQALREGKPIGEKIITISGDGVKHPVNVRVPFGTKVSEIIEAIGGYATEDVHIIAGGPMMGKTITTDQFVITSYANAITVLKTQKIDPLPCLRCGRCNDTCPAGLLPVRINNAEAAKDLNLIEKLRADQCIECGLCSYVCPSKIDVTEGVRRAKRALQLRKK
jgi:Na+-translocating ferredoxin:NAD+ oxidoreductase subunit C